MATIFFLLEHHAVCLAGLKETLVLGGFSGSEIYLLCFKMSRVYVLLCFSMTRRSGVHPSCMSLS